MIKPISKVIEATHFTEASLFALSVHDIKAATLEDSSWNVYERIDFNPQTIFAAVGKGGIVMPIISSRFFDVDSDEMVYSVIYSVNRVSDKTILFNPFTQKLDSKSLSAFIDEWTKDGGDCVTAFNNKENVYNPQFLDLSHINLSADLVELGEMMAENAHNVWALERQSEGWTYGRERNDRKLETPDMIPYSELPESEKQYDRIMATNTIKQLIALGYDIVKK